MEDYANFALTYGNYIFRQEHLTKGRKKGDEAIYTAWLLIVQIVEHYLLPQDDYSSGPQRGTPEGARHGAKLTRSLGVLMEKENFASNLFTYNMHLIACR